MDFLHSIAIATIDGSGPSSAELSVASLYLDSHAHYILYYITDLALQGLKLHNKWTHSLSQLVDLVFSYKAHFDLHYKGLIYNLVLLEANIFFHCMGFVSQLLRCMGQGFLSGD